MRIILFCVLLGASLNINAQDYQKQLDSLKEVYHGRALHTMFNDVSSPSAYLSTLDNTIDEIQDVDQQALARIAIFSHLYGFKWVPDKKLIKWFERVEKETDNNEILQIASETYDYYVNGIIGQQLKEISLPGMDGKNINTADFKGKFLVIDLWATWCGPCLQQMKEIQTLREKYPQSEFYSISFDPDFERVQRYVRSKGYQWPIVYAGKDHPIWDYFRVGALPNYFIVDPDGKIVVNTIQHIESHLDKVIRSYKDR